MARSKSSGRSPAKKTGRTPARHTTPRKKSRTPSRKNSAKKSPAQKRGRSRSQSKSRATTPKKGAGRPHTPTKTPAKSPRSSPQRQTPRGRPRSSSRSSTKSSTKSSIIPSNIGQKAQQVARTIEHKIASPIESVASKLRSRRDAYERKLNNASHAVTSYAHRRAPAVQSIWHRARGCVSNTIRSVPRRFRWANVKRHFKKNWRRYATVALIAAAGYYSYQNKKQIQGLLNEQYNKMAALVEQQKGSSFSKYFSGWLNNETATTTQAPPTIPPRTVDQQQVPQPQHHATQTVG